MGKGRWISAWCVRWKKMIQDNGMESCANTLTPHSLVWSFCSKWDWERERCI